MGKSKAGKSHLTEIELKHYENLLLEKRLAVVEQLSVIDSNIDNLSEADDADFSSITHHLGDIGSDAEEQTLNFQLKERMQKFLEEIDEALLRIQDGTYGICQATGKPIPKERLESVPHTRFSIEAKELGIDENL